MASAYRDSCRYLLACLSLDRPPLMADFDTAVEVVLRHEGGYANNKNDKGGPTNWGITTAVYSRYIGRQASAEDVRAMPQSIATKIYAQNYWAAIKGDSIKNQDFANVFFDMSVLRGTSAAARSIQSVLGITADGIIGSKSLQAINAVVPAVLIYAFQRECVAAFCRIVRADTTQVEFLSNWTSRVLELNPVMRA